MRYMKGIFTALLVAVLATGSIILLVWLSGRNTSGGNEGGYAPPTGIAMDTTLDFIIRNRGEGAKGDVAAAVAVAKQIEDDTSLFKASSDVQKINEAAGKSSVKVHDDTMAIIEKSIEYSERTGGALDVTVAPVEKLWGFYSGKYHVPTDAELAAVLPLVNYKDIVVDRSAGTVMLKRPGMMIDLGGEAKGYALAAMSEKLKERGVTSALINFGGSVAAVGSKGSGGWVVGVKKPRGASGELAGTMLLTNAFASTSGDYERFFIRDGVRYCHILDPRTGKQPRSLQSVTLVGGDPFVEDVVDTALFVMGPEGGMQFAKGMTGFEAMFIDANGKASLTPTWQSKTGFQRTP